MDRRKHAADESAALEGRDALVGLSFKAIDKVGGTRQRYLAGILEGNHDLVVTALGNLQVFTIDGTDVVNGCSAIKPIKITPMNDKPRWRNGLVERLICMYFPLSVLKSWSSINGTTQCA